MKATLFFNIRDVLRELDYELSRLYSRLNPPAPFEELKHYWIADRLRKLHMLPVESIYPCTIDYKTRSEVSRLSQRLDTLFYSIVRIPHIQITGEAKIDVRYVDLIIHLE